MVLLIKAYLRISKLRQLVHFLSDFNQIFTKCIVCQDCTFQIYSVQNSPLPLSALVLLPVTEIHMLSANILYSYKTPLSESALFAYVPFFGLSKHVSRQTKLCWYEGCKMIWVFTVLTKAVTITISHAYNKTTCVSYSQWRLLSDSWYSANWFTHLTQNDVNSWGEI